MPVGVGAPRARGKGQPESAKGDQIWLKASPESRMVRMVGGGGNAGMAVTGRAAPGGIFLASAFIDSFQGSSSTFPGNSASEDRMG